MPAGNKTAQTNEITCADFAAFENASQALIGAMGSKRPLHLRAFQRHFAVYNAGLNSIAHEMLASRKGPNSESDVKTAIEQFHREMIACGFKKYLASGEQEFLPTARKEMRKICTRLAMPLHRQRRAADTDRRSAVNR